MGAAPTRTPPAAMTSASPPTAAAAATTTATTAAVPRKPRVRQREVCDVTIERLNPRNGRGMATLPSGVTISVPYTLPGEEVRVRVVKRAHEWMGELLDVRKPSPKRVQPPCKYFGKCAGCQLQHMSYSDQLEFKREVLQRVFKPAKIPPIVPSPLPLNYRTKFTPHFIRPQRLDEGPLNIGMTDLAKHVVDIGRCELSSDVINQRYAQERQQIVANKADLMNSVGNVTLFYRETLAQTTDGRVVSSVTTDPNSTAIQLVSGKLFQFMATTFFQNNAAVLPSFVDYVTAQAAGPDVRFLVDAYCGAGLFAICGAAHFEKATAVDVASRSVESARKNARTNNVNNISFVDADADTIFKGLTYAPNETSVIVDPPAKGCSLSFMQQLIKFHPQRIVYVSCNPFSQLHDIHRLQSQADYGVTAVQAFDMFPQTSHIETVVTLRRRNANERSR